MGKPFRIRNRIPHKDDPFLLQLIQENLASYPSSYGLTEDKVIHLLNKHTRVVLLTTKKGVRIGFLSWTEKPPVMILELCVIDRKYQGQGIATYYIQDLENYARHRDFTTLRFYVDLKNEEAQKLYKRFGFTPKRINPFTSTVLMEKVYQ
ncbi:MAG TPA: GNAT family N-acetyltransferase [Bacillota bacterium]|nr:GNAT family N-acetyltransferase [Bacillota bacterium]